MLEKNSTTINIGGLIFANILPMVFAISHNFANTVSFKDESWTRT
jgi:hypothetical protein